MKTNCALLLSTTVLISLSQLLSSCTISKQSARFKLMMNDDYCVSNITSNFNEIMPQAYNPDSVYAKDTLLNKTLSRNEFLVANATGTVPLIRRLIANSKKDSAVSKLTNLELRQQLQEKTIRIKSILDELSAEINCEAGRTKRAADFLGGFSAKRNNQLTIGTIFAGSVTTAAPLVIKNTKAQNATVVTGAIAAAYLGVKLLQSGHSKVQFTYERNLLSDIWVSPKQATQYPAFIWFLLTRPELNMGDNRLSIQQNIKKRWSNIELNGADNNTLNLIFKNGGSYSQDDLNTRIILLNQLEASVRLLNSAVESYFSSIQKKFTSQD